MDSISSMNRALVYIENHLSDEIDYQEVAQIANCTEYHFRRMFSTLAGISLSEYIRRRKMSCAAMDLRNEENRIIDVAIKYGYGSADAFSRAFQATHGVLPSDARNNAVLKAYPKMTFQLAIHGGKEMNYRIIEKEQFKIVGFKKRVPIIFNGVNPEIQKMYGLLTPEIIFELKSMSNLEPQGMISASVNFSEDRMDEKGELDHYIGVATTNETMSQYDSLDVPTGTWAVFESIGVFPETLQNIWGRIYSEWFPTSGYESINGPEIVWHESPDTSNPNYKSEIWIPVRKIEEM